MTEEQLMRLVSSSPAALAILLVAWLFKRTVFPWLDVKWDEWKEQQKLGREIAAERTKTGERMAVEMHRLADKLAGGFNGRRDTDAGILKPPRREENGSKS